MNDSSNLYQYIEDKNVVRFAYPGNMPYISPDGTKIASEGNNSQIKLWSAETGAKLKTPVLVNSQYDKRVFAAAFSPNGELVARSANTGDRPLTVWDTNTGKKVSEQQKLIQDNGEEFMDNVFSMIFSNNGLKILAGCDKGELFIMDAKTGVIIKKINNRRVFDRLYHGVTSVAFSPDDKRIASGANNIVKVWDAESGACLATLKGSDYNSERAVSLAFSPNGEKIASGFSDKSVQVWDIESGELVNTLKGHNGGVGFVFFSPDGRRIISGCPEDRTLRVWDAETGKCGTILNIPENEYGPLSVTVLKDSNNKETIVVVSTSIGNVNNNWFVKNNTCNIRKWTNVDEKYNLLKFASEGNAKLMSKSDLDLLNKLYKKKTAVEKEGKTLSPLELRMYNSLLKKYDFSIIMHSDLLQRNTLGYLKGEEPTDKERNLDFKESNPTMGYFPDEDKPPAPLVGDTGCFGAMCSTRKGGRSGVRKTRRHRKNKTNKHKKPHYKRIRTFRNKK